MMKYILFLFALISFTLSASSAVAVESIVSADIIEGQATVKNYVKHKGHFEKNSNGVVSYKDAAQATPENGTLGTALGITCARTTSSPLAGVGSLLITKTSGASRQGEGCSLDFTISEKDKAKPMRIAFDYLTAGTYVDGDLTVWIYDTVNNRVIQPSGSSILGVLISDRKVLEFQTSSDSVSYRLIWHVAVATNSANTVQIDDIEISRASVGRASAISDWISWNPTGCWSNGNVFYSGKWRQVGDSREYQVRVGISGGAPDSTTFCVNLPSGHTMDTNKLVSGESLLGSASAADSGTGYHAGVVLFNNSTSVYAAGENSSSVWTQAVPMTWASGDIAMLNFKAPIAGLGSGTVASSDTDTRVVAAIMSKSSSQSGINTNNSSVKITLDNKLYDTHGGVNTASSRYDVKVPGTYEIKGFINLQGANQVVNSEYRIGIYKNGSEIRRGQSFSPGAALGVTLTASALLELVSGDYVELYLFGSGNNSVSTLTVYGDSAVNAYTSMHISRLSGPAQIAASESINAVYKTSAGQTITNSGSGVEVIFGTKEFDSHGSTCNTSTGRCTAPVSGTYEICGMISYERTSINITNNSLYTLAIYKNGVFDNKYLDSKNYGSYASGAEGISLNGCRQVQLLSGDSVSLATTNTNNSTSPTLNTADAVNWISFKKVGNY